MLCLTLKCSLICTVLVTSQTAFVQTIQIITLIWTKNVVCSVDLNKKFLAYLLWRDFRLNNSSFASNVLINAWMDGKVLASEMSLKAIT